MTSEKLNRYFADEANDYLEQIDALLAGSGAPDASDLLRLVAGVRGSARMAGADSIGRLAGRLEDAVRDVDDSRLPWSDDLRATVAATVHEIRDLIASVDRWSDAEEERVRVALERWDREIGADRANSDTAVPIDALLYSVPIESLYFDDEGPHVLEPAAGAVAATGADGVVPIESLLYQGQAALRQAMSLRPAFEAIARGDGADGPPLSELVSELFDLIALGSATESRDA